MKHPRVGIALLLIIVMAVGYYLWKQSAPLPFSREDVVAVWLQPVPEGPRSPNFVLDPTNRDRPLSEISDAIPSPLPRDLWQGFGCDLGGNVVVEVRDGSEIHYGPCRYPDSIKDLRQRMLQVLEP